MECYFLVWYLWHSYRYLLQNAKMLCITQAVSEAKHQPELREEANNKASTQAAIDRNYTSGQLLSKVFKRASEKAKKIGKALSRLCAKQRES